MRNLDVPGMTPEQFIAAAEQCEIRNPPFPIEFDLDHHPLYPVVLVRVTLQVPDRDTGVIIIVGMVREYEPRLFPAGREDLVRGTIRDLIRGMFLHEFDECWHENNERVLDPHGGKRS